MLTDEEALELNEQMAFRLGWKYHPVPGLWCLAKDDYQFTIPDFCRDNHSAGYLLDWLDKEGLYYTLGQNQERRFHAMAGETYTGPQSHGHGETPVEALVRAILAAKEEGQK